MSDVNGSEEKVAVTLLIPPRFLGVLSELLVRQENSFRCSAADDQFITAQRLEFVRAANAFNDAAKAVDALRRKRHAGDTAATPSD